MDHVQKITLGTCGWSYDEWAGSFYPDSWPAQQRLAYYARHFSGVEIDSTFYHPPSAQAARNWAEATPPEFVFCPKLPREITHERKLRDCRAKVDEFLQSLEPLDGKLGCVLIQLPPYFRPRADEFALRQFILELPQSVRWAMEFRHPAWHVPRLIHLLEEHGISWVWSDLTASERQEEAAFEFLPRTTDFLYVRLLGDPGAWSPGGRVGAQRPGELLWSREAGLENWAVRIRQALPEVGRAFLFAGNQFEGFGPATIRRLGQRLGITPAERVEEDVAGHPAAADGQLNLW